MSNLKFYKELPTVSAIDAGSILSISGLTLWLEYDYGVYTDTGLTTPAAVGQTVKGWQDRSGNGYHATEATNPPTLAADGLSFDGSNDVLKVTRMTGQFSNGFSYFLVINLADGRPSATDNFWGAFQTSGTLAYFAVTLSTAGALVPSVYSSSPVTPTLITLSDGAISKFIVGSTATPASNLVNYYNGALPSTTSISALNWGNIATSVTEAPYIGALNRSGTATDFTTCTIQALLIYNRPLTSGELLVVHRYLGNRHGISVP